MGSYTNAMLRRHPKFAFMLGDLPPDDFVSNGASWAPDVLFSVSFRPAAHFHDYGYGDEHPGRWCPVQMKSIRDEWLRYQLDQEFKENLLICGAHPWVARMYYYRVRLWGHRHFKYSKGCEPKRNLRFWLNLLIGRYVEW